MLKDAWILLVPFLRSQWHSCQRQSGSLYPLKQKLYIYFFSLILFVSCSFFNYALRFSFLPICNVYYYISVHFWFSYVETYLFTGGCEKKIWSADIRNNLIEVYYQLQIKVRSCIWLGDTPSDNSFFNCYMECWFLCRSIFLYHNTVITLVPHIFRTW